MARADTPSVDDLDAALASASPNLTAEDLALTTAVYRLLARGAPVRLDEVAQVTGLGVAGVAARLARWPGVFQDERGRLVGFWGLALPAMGHRFRTGGRDLFTWCAWDPLFVARIVGPAHVTTSDPVTGEAIRYRLDAAGGMHDQSHPEGVVSFLAPSTAWDDDVMTTFCHFVRHFASMTSGARWVAEHPGTFLLPLSDAVELARRHAERIAHPLGDDRERQPTTEANPCQR